MGEDGKEERRQASRRRSFDHDAGQGPHAVQIEADRENRTDLAIRVAVLALFAFSAVGVLNQFSWTGVIASYYSPIWFVRSVLACFLAATAVCLIPIVIYMTRRRTFLGPDALLRSIGPGLAVFWLILTSFAAAILVLYLSHNDWMWNPIRIFASADVLGLTLWILLTIASRQSSNLLKTGYFATGLLLVAETLMVILS